MTGRHEEPGRDAGNARDSGTTVGDTPVGGTPVGGAGQRLDKWLHHARFFKTRSLAARIIQSGGVRVDGAVVSKAHWQVRPGQVLTFVQSIHVRVVRVVSLPDRRGPAVEATAAYEDLSPPSRENAMPRPSAGAPASRETGAGRPTKRERRQIDAFTGRDD